MKLIHQMLIKLNRLQSLAIAISLSSCFCIPAVTSVFNRGGGKLPPATFSSDGHLLLQDQVIKISSIPLPDMREDAALRTGLRDLTGTLRRYPSPSHETCAAAIL